MYTLFQQIRSKQNYQTIYFQLAHNKFSFVLYFKLNLCNIILYFVFENKYYNYNLGLLGETFYLSKIVRKMQLIYNQRFRKMQFALFLRETAPFKYLGGGGPILFWKL